MQLSALNQIIKFYF